MTDISKEYAAALFALAREGGTEREFSAALALIDRALTAQPEYGLLLSSPNIPLRERLGLLDEAFGEQVPEYVLSFTKILCEKGHIRQFSACVEEYENIRRPDCQRCRADRGRKGGADEKAHRPQRAYRRASL